MTEFAPVFFDEPLRRGLSQTFLRHFNQCPRSGFLYERFRGQVNTPEMARGSAFHEIAARATRMGMVMDEPTIPPDVVKDLADEVLGEFPVPLEQHDYVREMAFRWASEFGFDPDYVVACETLFALEVGEWTVRARVDFAERVDRALLVRDYKTSRAAPAWDEVARKSRDGRLVAKNFQLVLYALVMAFGLPLEEHKQECPDCDGTGFADHEGCERCDDSGWLVTEEPAAPNPIAAGVDRFDLEFVYPGIEDREGKMVRRQVTLDRLELAEYKASLEGLITRVVNAESSGYWPAVVSDAACSECPAPGECPIPREVRDWRGRINTPEQAAEAAMVLDRRKAELRAAQTELRNFAKSTGHPIRFGDKVMEFVYSESESFDHKGFLAATQHGAVVGTEVEVEDYVRVRGKTDFKARDLTAEEREQDG